MNVDQSMENVNYREYLVTLSHFICKISMTLWYVLAAFYKVAAFAFLISGNEYAAEITSICIKNNHLSQNRTSA